MLLLNLLACASPFEGTWLFMVDLNTRVTGDCADAEGGSGYTFTGTENEWVDIYRLDSGEFAVFIGEPLVGANDGNVLTASWEESYESDGYSETESITFEGTLEGGIMTGTVADSQVEQEAGGASYSCTEAYAFTAERTISARDTYAGE